VNTDDASWEVSPAKLPRRSVRARWYIFVALLVPWTVLTYVVVSGAPPGDGRDRPVAFTTLAAISGPFVGAIARNGQECCLATSIRLATIVGLPLAIGILFQFVPIPVGRYREALRLVLWTCGWLAWFAGGCVSFLHALF
jgi:hypothetical protein